MASVTIRDEAREVTCPNCGARVAVTVYDIGSGPECSCPVCEWCWGANGQSLAALDYASVRAEIAEVRAQHAEDPRAQR